MSQGDNIELKSSRGILAIELKINGRRALIICLPTALIFARGYLADLCLYNMSITFCCHIYYFEFVDENINMFLSNLSEFKQPYLPNPVRYFIQIFRIFYTYQLLSSDRRLKVEIVKVPKLAFSGEGLLGSRCSTCQGNLPFISRSGRGALVIVLVLQSWGRWFDLQLLQSFKL